MLRDFRLLSSPWDWTFHNNSPLSYFLLNWSKTKLAGQQFFQFWSDFFNSRTPSFFIHDSISQADPFTFLIMMEVVVGWLLSGCWAGPRAVDDGNPQLTISSHWGDGGWRLSAAASNELRMRMVAAIRGGLPAEPPEPRTPQEEEEEEEEGEEEEVERSRPAPRLRRRRRGGRGGHHGQPGGILT